MYHTTTISDGFLRALEIPKHLWNNAGSETEVKKREIAEEEIHGCMEFGFMNDRRMITVVLSV
jgi:hypothetical protein